MEEEKAEVVPTTTTTEAATLDDAFQSELDQICKNLQSQSDRITKQKALNQLLGRVKEHFWNTEKLVAVFDGAYLHLLQLYEDRFESVRLLTAEVVTIIVNELPVNEFYLDCIIPVLAKRIGMKETIEESEELRLLLLQQVLRMVEKFHCKGDNTNDHLLKSYNDICDILVKCLADPFPAIQRECCDIIKVLAEATPSFHFRAEALVNPLVVMLRHRQSPNRVAAIEALGIVSLHIFTNHDVVTKIIVEMSPLLMDNMPLVRRECGRVGCRMLLDLKDRYSLFERVLPLIFCCLKDPVFETRDEIEDLWVVCGEQYYKENEEELSQKELIDHPPRNYPSHIHRPTLGCRAIMQRSLRMISLILYEMQNWKEDVRLHSVHLMWQVALHAERALTAKFIEICPVLTLICEDEDKQVAKEAVALAELLGVLLEYHSWIDHGLEQLNARPSIGSVKSFTAMFGGASDIKRKDYERVVRLISESSEFCHRTDEEFQLELLKLVELLVDLHLEVTENSLIEALESMTLKSSDICCTNLYIILMKIKALSSEKCDAAEQAIDLLERLARSESKMVVFHENYFNEVLKSIDGLDALNTENSIPICLLHGLICYAGFRSAYLEPLKESLNIALNNAEQDGVMKLLSSISIAMLRWTDTMGGDCVEELRSFITELIKNRLVWQVGRSAEAVRTMATSVICSMAQGAPVAAVQIIPEMIVQIIGLLDDNSVGTRAYAVKCLNCCGPIGYDELKLLAVALLGRLNDPSAEVRRMSAKNMQFLKIKEDCSVDEMDSWEAIVKQVFAKLLLHLDDPDNNIRQAVLDTLKVMGKDHPKSFHSAIENVPANFPYANELEKIKTEIPIE